MAPFSAKSRKIKFWWHLTLAYLKRYQLRLYLFVFVILSFSYLIYKFSANLIGNNTISIGYVGSYTLETVPTNILSLATKSLITQDAAGRNVPSLASYWTTADEGKTYIVFLKDNLEWHDGTPVEAKDISLAISGVEITALNNKAIQFKLPNPIASFPQVLNTPVFKIKSFYGIGDYRIVAINKIDTIVKKISLHPKDEKLPQVEIKFYPSEELAINALKIGEIKVLSSAAVKTLENWPNLSVKKEIAPDELVTVFFNTQDSKLMSKDFRQALSYAINKENFDGQSATGPISFASWAYNPNVKKYEYNLGRAKELYSKSEIKDNKITLSYLSNLESLAKSIKGDWEALGLKVELKEEKVIPKEYQALLAIDKLPQDPDQYALWHSTQKNTNITRYTKNVKIDKLLEDARSTLNEDERKAIYADFQRFLTDDDPAIFLYNPYKYQISYKNIEKLLTKLPKI